MIWYSEGKFKEIIFGDHTTSTLYIIQVSVSTNTKSQEVVEQRTQHNVSLSALTNSPQGTAGLGEAPIQKPTPLASLVVLAEVDIEADDELLLFY